MICNVVPCYERCETYTRKHMSFYWELVYTASVFVSAAFTVKCPWLTLWVGGERLLHLCLLSTAGRDMCILGVHLSTAGRAAH